MTDSAEFLNAYRETLTREVSGRWPAEWLAAYELESCLKSHGGKEVYVARDKLSGNTVILRTTDADAADQADAEADVLRRLDHPGIPKAYDSRVVDGRSYLAREYLPGIPLDEMVAGAPLTAAETLAVGRQLADILRYLHRQEPPVVHRDLKPQNIIRRPDGSIGLTDFGIARTMKPDAGADTTSAGTMAYAPPEQFGYAQSTPQTDIYSFGIVLIHLATGSPERGDLVRRIPDADLRALVEKCTAFDPANRFESAGQILRTLDGIGARQRRSVIIGIAVVLGLSLVASAAATMPSGVSSAGPATTPVVSPATGSGSGATIAGLPSIAAPPKTGKYLGSGSYPGNLSNGGFAVAGDDEIYVATASVIVVLDLGGRYLRALDAPAARSLNFYDGLLYFRIGDEIRRADPRTGQASTLVAVPGEHVFIDSGRLYYTDATDSLALYSATLNGRDRRRVNTARYAYYRQLSAGWMIYAQDDDAELMLTNLTTAVTYRPGYAGATWSAVWDGHLYYKRDYRELHRLNLSTGADEVLARQNYDFMVATEAGLFGLSTTTETLNHLSPDGALNTVVGHRTGAFCAAGEWIIYHDGGLKGPLRMVRMDGSADQPLPTR